MALVAEPFGGVSAPLAALLGAPHSAAWTTSWVRRGSTSCVHARPRAHHCGLPRWSTAAVHASRALPCTTPRLFLTSGVRCGIVIWAMPVAPIALIAVLRKTSALFAWHGPVARAGAAGAHRQGALRLGRHGADAPGLAHAPLPCRSEQFLGWHRPSRSVPRSPHRSGLPRPCRCDCRTSLRGPALSP